MKLLWKHDIPDLFEIFSFFRWVSGSRNINGIISRFMLQKPDTIYCMCCETPQSRQYLLRLIDIVIHPHVLEHPLSRYKVLQCLSLQPLSAAAPLFQKPVWFWYRFYFRTWSIASFNSSMVTISLQLRISPGISFILASFLIGMTTVFIPARWAARGVLQKNADGRFSPAPEWQLQTEEMEDL